MKEQAREDGAPEAEMESTIDTGSVGRDLELSERLDSLAAENERLRDAVSDAHRRRYRFTALGFGIIGAIALIGAAVFPAERTVLLALGGTGMFGAVLTAVLTPERVISASVGDRIYETLADNEAAIVADLSLEDESVIIPTSGRVSPARLFIPAFSGMIPTDTATLSAPFVTGDNPGLSLEPTGVGLYNDLADATAQFPDTSYGIATVVGDALVEQFELLDAVDIDSDAERVTMAVDGSLYGSVDRFDHPVASVLATTLAVELDRPVTVSVAEGDRADWLVTCTFEHDAN